MTKPRKTVVIERDRTKVTLIIECGDIYRAMATYEEIIRSLKDGLLVLEVDEPRQHPPSCTCWNCHGG